MNGGDILPLAPHGVKLRPFSRAGGRRDYSHKSLALNGLSNQNCKPQCLACGVLYEGRFAASDHAREIHLWKTGWENRWMTTRITTSKDDKATTI